MAPSPRSSPWRRIHLSDGVRGLWPGVYSGVPGAGVRWLCPLSVKHSRGRAHCDGVQGATTLRRRRRAVSGAQDRALGCVPTPARPVTPPPLSATAEARCDGVGRRPKTPLDDQGERSPASATAAAALWFQSQRQRQMGPHCWHNETAQALQHGCGDDCWRSASLAALHCTRDR